MNPDSSFIEIIDKQLASNEARLPVFNTTALRIQEEIAKGEPEVLQPKEESRLKITYAKNRFGLDQEGKPLPKLKTLTYAESLFEAMMHRFYATQRA